MTNPTADVDGTLSALADTLGDVADGAELGPDADGRPTLTVFVAELDRYTIIQEGDTLPPWAEITGVDVLVDDAALEALDADAAVAVYIQDRRDREGGDE